MNQFYNINGCTIEILTDGDRFLGIGATNIGDTKVRSGRLPIRPFSQSFKGAELADMKLLDVTESHDEIRIATEAVFKAMPVKLMKDHSLDPIHDLEDWDAPRIAGTGKIDIVLKPAADVFDGTKFTGFSYQYEYSSENIPLFYLLDMASWELDGDITGATAISQSSCSDPVAEFADDTAWTTEGVIHWVDEASMANRTMTHNLPRWASHQAFDFQYKGNKTLIGVFENVDLIRTTLRREANKPELKTFDKYIFDESLSYKTPAKKIMLNADAKTKAGQRNLWTRIIDDVHDRARAEFGLKEEPLIPFIHNNHWDAFTFDDYLKDLLPAAKSLGFKQVFIDNVNKSAMSEKCPHPDFHWNMCCGHEYEISDNLGGAARLKEVMDEFKKAGVRVLSWTNNDQALSSPINSSERDEKLGWFVKMEDTRNKYGGAYTAVMSALDFKVDGARNYWTESLKKVKEQTGLDAWLFDSFYNLGFMPVNYSEGKPTVQWRGTLQAFKELQDAGINFHIESFGAFGTPFHGCPQSYGQPHTMFATYKIYAQIGYTTIPTGDAEIVDDADMVYHFFAHMASPLFTLYQNGKYIADLWGEKHKQALADYNNNRLEMNKRFLQNDGQSVLWHNADATRATLWNFVSREVALPGSVYDLTADKQLEKAEKYHLQACHTYAISDTELPTVVG